MLNIIWRSEMKSLLALWLCLLCSAAMAQQGTAVSLAPSDLQGTSFSCYTTPAVGAVTACSINVPANQHAYINFLQVGVCFDNNGAVAGNLAQGTFGSTNLNGWQQQISFLGGAAATSTGIVPSCTYVGGLRSHPLVSAAGPVTATITTPTTNAHLSYPINVEYYLAQ
jgi:hypothetical protein